MPVKQEVVDVSEVENCNTSPKPIEDVDFEEVDNSDLSPESEEKEVINFTESDGEDNESSVSIERADIDMSEEC